MDNRHALWITWALLIVLIILVAVRLFVEVRNEGVLDQSIRTHIEKVVTDKVNKLEEPQNGVDGYTPIKGVDYFDGASGEPGKNGVDGKGGEKGEDGVDGENGTDGLTPELRCNELKNRWEVRYDQVYNWEILSGTPIRCTVTLGDILEVLEEYNGNQ